MGTFGVLWLHLRGWERPCLHQRVTASPLQGGKAGSPVGSRGRYGWYSNPSECSTTGIAADGRHAAPLNLQTRPHPHPTLYLPYTYPGGSLFLSRTSALPCSALSRRAYDVRPLRGTETQPVELCHDALLSTLTPTALSHLSIVFDKLILSSSLELVESASPQGGPLFHPACLTLNQASPMTSVFFLYTLP